MPLTASAAAGRGKKSVTNINDCSKSRTARRRARDADPRLACDEHTFTNVTRPAIPPFLAGLDARTNLDRAS
jgi:hypothetical protein